MRAGPSSPSAAEWPFVEFVPIRSRAGSPFPLQLLKDPDKGQRGIACPLMAPLGRRVRPRPAPFDSAQSHAGLLHRLQCHFVQLCRGPDSGRLDAPQAGSHRPARAGGVEASRNYVLFEIPPWALAHAAILGYTSAKMRNSRVQPPSPRADLTARTGPGALVQQPPCWFPAGSLCE